MDEETILLGNSIFYAKDYGNDEISNDTFNYACAKWVELKKQSESLENNNSQHPDVKQKICSPSQGDGGTKESLDSNKKINSETEEHGETSASPSLDNTSNHDNTNNGGETND